MNDKILIAYASRTGFTIGVAEAIAKTLAEGGGSVEVRPMQGVKDLTPYRAVVAGSAIQGKRWLPEAQQFVQAQRAALAQKPFAAFLVCMTLAMRNGENYRPVVAEFMAPVRALVKPVSEGLFAGRIGHSQNPIVGRQGEVSFERPHGRLVGGRSPGLECHSCLGGSYPPTPAKVMSNCNEWTCRVNNYE